MLMESKRNEPSPAEITLSRSILSSSLGSTKDLVFATTISLLSGLAGPSTTMNVRSNVLVVGGKQMVGSQA